MKVEVFSINAAVGGTQHGTTWKGEIPNEIFARCSSNDGMLDLIFRLLNRVDEGDHERMLGWGYELPSLSVGDYVTLHLNSASGAGVEPVTFVVASLGFKQVTGNHEYIPIRI
jgi:hypothetical protein